MTNTCQIFQKSFSDENGLWQHTRAKHPGARYVGKCGRCGEMFCSDDKRDSTCLNCIEHECEVKQ